MIFSINLPNPSSRTRPWGIYVEGLKIAGVQAQIWTQDCPDAKEKW
jgi:hypothetical protein